MVHNIIIGRNEADMKRLGMKGLLFIGKNYVKMGQTTSLSSNIYLDVNNAHVVLVSGKRGSGKSYCLSVMAEEVTRLHDDVKKNLAVLILDTMGIFWSMKYPNLKQEDELKIYNLKPQGLDVKVYTPKGKFDEYKKKNIPTDFNFSIKPSELDASDWCNVFNIELMDDKGVLIERVIGSLKGDYNIDDIIKEISKDKKSTTNIKNAVENRFRAAKVWGLFDKEGTKIKDIIKPGEVSILDVSCYTDWNIKTLVIGILGKKLLQERMDIRKLEEMELIEEGRHYFNLEKKKKGMPLVWIMIDECLPYDSEIITNKAHTKIGDIVERFENGEKFKVLGYDTNKHKYNYYDVKGVYKKGKRKVIKLLTESGRKLECTENHRILTKRGFVHSLFAEEIGIPLFQHYDQNKKSIVARLLGYLLGDGWLSKSKMVGFSGKKNTGDLIKIKEDLLAIGLSSSNIYTKKTKSNIKHKGKEYAVKGISSSIHVSRKGYYFFKKYGIPEGKRVLKEYTLPSYILNASEKERCEFLAGLMGADGYKISINRNCKVDFNPIRFSFHKDEKLENNALKFASDLKKLFESIGGIKISKISKFEGNLRKDGIKTIKIVLTISKEINNTIKFLEKIGYRYCEYKEINGNKWLNYLKLKLNFVNKKKKLKSIILKEYKQGTSGHSLSKKYSVPYYQIKWWLKVKDKPSVDHKFIKFDEWENRFCSDKIFYEKILNKEEIGEKEVYDISVDGVHNFIANGCIVHNCHEFLPREGKTAASDALIQILREGRQPGISLVLATQQPGEIAKDVMTQSDIVISFRVTAKLDIEALNSIMQTYLTGDILSYLNNLPRVRGSAIILDDNSERIYPFKTRPKLSWHGGDAPSAVRIKKNILDLGI